MPDDSRDFLRMLKENEARTASFLFQVSTAAAMAMQSTGPLINLQRSRDQLARALSRIYLGWDGLTGAGIFRTTSAGTVLADSELARALEASWFAGVLQAVSVNAALMNRMLTESQIRTLRGWSRPPLGAPLDGIRGTVLRNYDHPMRRDYLDGRVLEDRVRQLTVDLIRRADEQLRIGFVMQETPEQIAARLKRVIEDDAGTKRLLRTEITNAYGAAFRVSAALNPAAEPMIDWVLHPAHGCCDICDVHAAKGPYPLDGVPGFPGHANCMCHLRLRRQRDKAEILRMLDLLNGYQTPVHPGFVTSLLRGR